MKCVCGYENEVDETGAALDDNEPFTRIYAVKDDGRTIPFSKVVWNAPSKEGITLYACPRCGTIKIEV